jgi:hypothetical protein
MTVKVESLAPKTGQLTIDIRLSATVNVTAFSARQKVTGFMADEIGTNMHGGEPSLAVGERICWRVPVILSMPPTGDRGQVGTIDVDVETGQLLVNRSLIEEIKHRAEHLATHASSPARPLKKSQRRGAKAQRCKGAEFLEDFSLCLCVKNAYFFNALLDRFVRALQ